MIPCFRHRSVSAALFKVLLKTRSVVSSRVMAFKLAARQHLVPLDMIINSPLRDKHTQRGGLVVLVLTPGGVRGLLAICAILSLMMALGFTVVSSLQQAWQSAAVLQQQGAPKYVFVDAVRSI